MPIDDNWTTPADREYDDRPIPEEMVRRLLEAARLTGSSMNGGCCTTWWCRSGRRCSASES